MYTDIEVIWENKCISYSIILTEMTWENPKPLCVRYSQDSPFCDEPLINDSKLGVFRRRILNTDC